MKLKTKSLGEYHCTQAHGGKSRHAECYGRGTTVFTGFTLYNERKCDKEKFSDLPKATQLVIDGTKI